MYILYEYRTCTVPVRVQCNTHIIQYSYTWYRYQYIPPHAMNCPTVRGRPARSAGWSLRGLGNNSGTVLGDTFSPKQTRLGRHFPGGEGRNLRLSGSLPRAARHIQSSAHGWMDKHRQTGQTTRSRTSTTTRLRRTRSSARRESSLLWRLQRSPPSRRSFLRPPLLHR